MVDKETDDLRNSARVWLERALEEFDVQSSNQLSLHKCKQPLKDKLAELLWDGLSFVEKQNDRLTDLKNSVNVLKSELIESQRTVIDLQETLLESKDKQLQSLQQTVKSSVEDTVKAEFQSYSSMVQKTATPPGPVFNSETLRKVVQTAVREEDRTRNIMVFGLPEQAGEELTDSVAEVLQHIGVKPKMEACRVGRAPKGTATRPRPVKVTLSSSSTVNQIISNARTLRNVLKFKSVFIGPDRSLDDQEKQRQLVRDLKKMNIEEPKKRHFIRGGIVCSVDKSVK